MQCWSPVPCIGGKKWLGSLSASSSVFKRSLVLIQIRLLMFLMNWAVVFSSSVNSHCISFKLALDSLRGILSGAYVGQFYKVCLVEILDLILHGQLLV